MNFGSFAVLWETGMLFSHQYYQVHSEQEWRRAPAIDHSFSGTECALQQLQDNRGLGMGN